MSDFHDLLVWKRGFEFVKLVYRLNIFQRKKYTGLLVNSAEQTQVYLQTLLKEMVAKRRRIFCVFYIQQRVHYLNVSVF